MRANRYVTLVRVGKAAAYGLLAGGFGGGLIGRDLLGLSTVGQTLLWAAFAAMGAVAGFSDRPAGSMAHHRWARTATVAAVLAIVCFVLIASPWNVVVVAVLAVGAALSALRVERDGMPR